MHRERKLVALRRSLKDEGYARGQEANFYCPKHEHHKRKLAVNIENDRFHCWVCGWGGYNILPLLAFGGKDHPDYVDYAAELEKPKDIVEKQFDKVRLPTNFRPLCVDFGTLYYRQAIRYLADRGITAEDILLYKLGYVEEGQYADRIIIPSFDEYGELNFFVGRGIWERVSPPYLSGKFDKDIIFNDLLADWSKPITLVEGPFDAIKAGTNAIPLQGKFPSKKLVDKIIARKPKVNIALDEDAMKFSFDIAQQLLNYGVDVSIISFPEELKDPGNMSKEQFEGFRQKATPFKGIVDVLKYKVMHSGTLENR